VCESSNEDKIYS